MTTRTPPPVDAIALRMEREEGIPGVRERIRGMRGDVLLEGFGLTPGRSPRSSETTYIIHGAATIRFDHRSTRRGT